MWIPRWILLIAAMDAEQAKPFSPMSESWTVRRRDGNTPKYGLIFHSTFIGRAQQKNKGRISRYLANKCSIASRIDCFSDEATTIFGEKLKDQVEERLSFLTEGTTPRIRWTTMEAVGNGACT